MEGGKMKKVILATLLVFMVFNNSFASRWDDIQYGQKFDPNWEINAQTNSEVPIFQIGGQAKIGGIGSCGIQSTAFYKLVMSLNKDTLQDLINNWQNLAFVGALYTVGTYFPIVKEAMVGAEMIANTIASLKNLNCQSAMNIMTTYFKGSSSDLVRACVANKLGEKAGIKVNPWELTEDKLRQIIEKAGATENAISSAYYYCMNNANLFDSFSFNSDALKKWLDKNNLRKWITCNYVSAFGMQDLGDRYSLSKAFLKGGDAKTMAQVALLAITPEWIITTADKEKILKPKTIEVDGRPLSPEYLFNLLKEGVDEDFNKLIEYAKNGDEKSYYALVRQMNEKFYLNSNEVLPYFDYMYLSFLTLKQYEDAKNYQKVLQLEPILKSYVASFKRQYYEIKKRSVEKQIVSQYMQAKQRYEAFKVAGKDSLERYCASNN